MGSKEGGKKRREGNARPESDACVPYTGYAGALCCPRLGIESRVCL